VKTECYLLDVKFEALQTEICWRRQYFYEGRPTKRQNSVNFQNMKNPRFTGQILEKTADRITAGHVIRTVI